MIKLLNGKALSEKIYSNIKEEVDKLNRKPHLVVISVGNDSASQVYIRNKKKACEKVGMTFEHIQIDNSKFEGMKETMMQVLAMQIQELNEDEKVHGILVQMPLPSHIDAKKVQDAVNPEKDVDGLNALNSGKLLKQEEGLLPCTPSGIITLLHAYQIPLCGRHAVVVGRSELVGKPLALLLLNEDATVTICHSKTEHLEQYTKMADILISAVGKKDFIRADMVKEGAVVIDVGMNRVDGKLYGDVKYDEVAPYCSYITPVPGGVGPMTVLELGENVYRAHQKQLKKTFDR